jgi:hypothetical protein
MSALLELVRLQPIPAMGAWIASFEFWFAGLEYNCFFACGMLNLTEREARAIMESNDHLSTARAMFLRDVILNPGVKH